MTMKGWIPVSKQHPCPICEKSDWCMIGLKGTLCNRVESRYRCPGGGWFHPFEAPRQPETLPAHRERPKPTLNPADLLASWPADGLQALATSLGVSEHSLASLGASRAFWRAGLWSLAHWPSSAWAFPMRDGGNGDVVGIRLRSDDGRKWAVAGSRAGLFIPSLTPQRIAFLPEGPTSTAAALTLGLYAIGRPSCSSGGSEIKIALRRLGVRAAVIVADNDDKPNGLRPGFDGAVKLAKEIGIKCVIWTPPTKDLRDFLLAGGTAQMITDQLKNLVWKVYR